MKQSDVVDHIVEELINDSVCANCYKWELEKYIAQAYAAGFDEGRLQYTKRKPVTQYTLWGEKVAEYESASIAARKVNISKHMISKCALGKNHTAGGFIWRYKEDEFQNSSKSDASSDG